MSQLQFIFSVEGYTMSTKPVKIGIVGAGVGGSVAAVRLASVFRAAEVVLMEKSGDILSGPPFCHLHAGGMLYTTMTDEEARGAIQ